MDARHACAVHVCGACGKSNLDCGWPARVVRTLITGNHPVLICDTRRV